MEAQELHDPLIDVAGSAEQMGLQHGQALRDRIHRAAGLMRERVGTEAYEAYWGGPFEATLAYCRERAPELVAEMEGIAEGAQIAFGDVFNINAHLDMLTWKARVWQPSGDAPGCSSHAIVTEDDVLLGWNGDDWRGWLGCGVVVRGRPDGGEPFIYWSLAGTVGRPGISRHLALGANSIAGPGCRPDGLLYPMVCRKILACRTTEDALGFFDAYARCSPMNYMIADASGDLVDIESGAELRALLRPERSGPGSFLLHTNSTLDETIAGGPVDADACPRLVAARRIYRKSPPQDASGVAKALRDHTGGICVHVGQSCTLVSFVAEIRAGRFTVTRGSPCTAPPRTYAVA